MKAAQVGLLGPFIPTTWQPMTFGCFWIKVSISSGLTRNPPSLRTSPMRDKNSKLPDHLPFLEDNNFDYAITGEGEIPIKVLANNIDKRLGGAAAVAALTVKKFCGKVEFVGRIGDDDASVFIKKELNFKKLKFSKSLILKNTSSSQSYLFEDKKGERLLANYSSKKILLTKKIPRFVLSGNHTYLFDIRWIEAALYLSKQSAIGKIKCVGDIDNFKMNKNIKKIVLNTTYPIFSENGLYDFCKIKSPLKALKSLFIFAFNFKIGRC